MKPDFSNPTSQQERLSAQDERLLLAARTLAKRVRAQDSGARVLIVGGFVRDALLGLYPKDLDAEVYGLPAEDVFAIVNELFPGKVDEVGRSFGILKIALGEGLEFDVSLPRRESKSGKSHKDFAVESDPGMSLKEAARRRDFTINSLAADPLSGEILDPFNGLQDLEARVLRVTDEERFQDDPLRVYRAVQLMARLGLSVEEKSFALMHEMVACGELEHLSAERVTEELKKLFLKAERPSLGLALMKDLGIIERHFPELHALWDTPQEPEWHPEGDVGIHTLMVVDEAAKIIRREKDELGFRAWIRTDEERLSVVLGALCHDLGKPSTTQSMEKEGVMRIRSLGHEEAGEAPTRTLFARLRFGEVHEQAAVAIAQDHLKPHRYALQLTDRKMTTEQYTNAIRKLLKRIHPTSWRVLVAAAEADARGRSIPDAQTKPYTPGEVLLETVAKFNLDEAPTKKLLEGRDLISTFGMKPGIELGKWQKAVEAARDTGEVKTKEEALEWVRGRLANNK